MSTPLRFAPSMTICKSASATERRKSSSSLFARSSAPAPAMESVSEAEPLVVGGLALEGEWRSSLGPVLKCDGRVAAFVGYGNYPLTLTE